MIKICSFFNLPVEHARIGTVWSIANSCPRNIRGIESQLRIFVPEWKSVKALREHRIGEEEFVAQYRELMRARWPKVKAWLASLGWKRKANLDLLSDLDALSAAHDVAFQHVRGHNGHPINERCDRIACLERDRARRAAA